VAEKHRPISKLKRWTCGPGREAGKSLAARFAQQERGRGASMIQMQTNLDVGG
jgi:hypothetical protein